MGDLYTKLYLKGQKGDLYSDFILGGGNNIGVKQLGKNQALPTGKRKIPAEFTKICWCGNKTEGNQALPNREEKNPSGIY